MPQWWIPLEHSQTIINMTGSPLPSQGHMKYSHLLNNQNGTIDDIMISRLPNGLHVTSNGTRYDAVKHCLNEHGIPLIKIPNPSISLQGPLASDILKTIGLDIPQKTRTFTHSQGLLIQRTGFTKCGGFDITGSELNMIEVMEEITPRAKPAGLLARDSLRIEAGFPLVGKELTPTRSFAASCPNVAPHRNAHSNWQMVKLETEHRRLIPEGSIIYNGKHPVGFVTSSTITDRGISIGYISGYYENMYFRRGSTIVPLNISKSNQRKLDKSRSDKDLCIV
jgi:aminomethyltransferase